MIKIILLLLVIFQFTNLKANTEVKYSAYLGGLQVANIFYSTGLENDKWEIKTTITASGLVDVFVSFTFSAESSGKYINDRSVSYTHLTLPTNREV